MNEIDAIRQIRRLDRLAIEKAFSEEEYPSLPDVLKIELVQRLEELKVQGAQQAQRKSPVFSPVMSFILLLLAVPIAIKIVDFLSK